jgi:hypothetical protein
MGQEHVNLANEALVVEVVHWLEAAAHNTDLARIARRISERKPPFVVFDLIAHFSAGEITGVEHVVKHPVKDFQIAVGLTDQEMRLLREFIGTIPNSEIRIGFEESERNGELLCLSQLNYVPRGTNDAAIQGLQDQLSKIFALSNVAEDCVFEMQGEKPNNEIGER